jgi:hypothetical protein
MIENRPIVVTEFDENLWIAIVDTATLGQDGGVAFKLGNDSEVTVRTAVRNSSCDRWHGLFFYALR